MIHLLLEKKTNYKCAYGMCVLQKFEGILNVIEHWIHIKIKSLF